MQFTPTSIADGGRSNFVKQQQIWGEAESAAAEAVLRKVEESGLETIRLSFADQHGLLRGKVIEARDLASSFRNGCAMTSSLLAKDTSHRSVFPVFSSGGGFGMAEMAGAGDIIMVPDPTTFHLLPWSPKSGWLLCDIYFTNGRPVPFSTRGILRQALEALRAAGYDYLAGLEVEFTLLTLEDAKTGLADAGQPGTPPEVGLLNQGFQYLTEQRYDEAEGILSVIRSNLVELGLPLRTIEVEFGPSQFELTLHPSSGLEAADTMVLLRSAVKQVCRRQGYHATFMCRPALPNVFSNGWHLHQSLWTRPKAAAQPASNAFTPTSEGKVLSEAGRQFVGGLLAHAPAASVFTTPTINGYKRFRPYTLAPDRLTWGRDNKGAMIRALGSFGDPATRIENRVGEPAANPYLYLASQIHAGLDGMQRQLDPGEPTDTPYEEAAPRLPQSLMDAITALRGSELYRSTMGAPFIDYLLTIKEAEVARFLAAVTDWEQREYFSLY